MKSYPNIETKPFRRASDGAPIYTAYGAGAVWHVTRSGRRWRADCRIADFHKIAGAVTLHADTLAGISAALDNVASRSVA